MDSSKRIPAIFVNRNGYLHITNSVNGNRNHYYDHKIKLQKWYKIIIEQVSLAKKVQLFSMFYLKYLMYTLNSISASVRVFSIYYQYSNRYCLLDFL